MDKRLNQADVLEVLRRGRRFAQPSFELRLLVMPAGHDCAHAKMAIAVPKRLLKSSVARNRIKRVVRETFRGHIAAAAVPAHILVTFKARLDGRKAETRQLFRSELGRLFNDMVKRAGNDRDAVVPTVSS